ncbi:MAG: cohesin domain-containing protein, partial [Saprospiraceae bacterium]
MTKRLLIPIFLSICFFQQAFAQVPVAVQVETPVPSLVSGSSMVCPAGVVADAGTTVQALDPAAQSNDVEFLCFNDVLSITHQGGQTFGDPDPVSAPGISYHFYDCSPTVSGPDLATLLTDPCILVDPGNGNPYATQFPTTAIDIDGNADFVNNGGVQAFFNGGNPIELFFAPVTIDDWANAVYETDGVGGDSGPCINSNTNDAFRVVYLNEIQGTNIDNGANGPCGGSFVAQGGLPEFDPMAIYTSISITLSTDPAVMGTTPLPFNVGHGEVVTFTVPQAGVYDIVLEDGKSCAATFQVDMNNCIEVETVIGNETANTGDQVCVPVTATGFDDLFGFQFTILFDETVLTFDNITLDQLPTTLSTSNPNPGEIIFSWVEDGLNGVTLAGTNILFEICFTAIGAPGTSSDLTFTGAPAPGGTPIEFSSFSGPRGYDLTNGSVSIAGGGGNIMVDFGVCTSLAGNTSGSFTASATGGSGTYSLDWEEIGNPGNTGSTTIPLGLVENLGPGFYSVTVTDNAGASVVENVLIPTTEPLSVQTIPTNPQCVNTGDGQIQLNVDDGVGPYTIEWSTGPGDDGVTLLQNLSPDDYTVTVTDNLGCVVSSSNSLQTPDLDITLINQQNITCATLGQSTGSLTVEATGDNPGFGYSWENSAMANIGSTATIDNLPSDTYTVTATDGNGCSIVANFTITEPVGPTIQSFDSISVSCPNDPSGSLTVNALPGDVPVASFAWDDPNNQTTQTASMLNAGTYTVTVTDDDGCSVIESASLFAPAPLDIVVTVTPPSCPGDATGVVAFTNNSPTDITFEWFDGNTAFQTIPGLTCGNSYSVTISDVNMCETIVIDTLMECPEVIDANLDTIPTPLTSCHLSNSVLCDAQLTAIPSG